MESGQFSLRSLRGAVTISALTLGLFPRFPTLFAGWVVFVVEAFYIFRRLQWLSTRGVDRNKA